MIIDVHVSDCSEGDILAADIYNREGVKLAACNTTMNSFIIKRLTELGISNVKIYDPPIKASSKEYQFKRFENSYKKNIQIAKDIIQGLASGKKLDLDKVSQATDTFYNYLMTTNSSDIVQCLSRIKNKDEYTYNHSVNVAFYSMLLAKWLGLPEEKIKKAVQAGFLHDIGKSKIPLNILNKASRLTEEEFEVIKKHPIYGYYILEESNFVDVEIKRAVLLHHERANSTGYPFSLPADKISVLTSIVSIADVYDAFTSDRVYKRKGTPFEAFNMFLTEGYADFDAYILTEFVNHMAVYLIGSDVMLNNGECAEVVFVPPYDVTQPILNSKGSYFKPSEKGLVITEIL